MSGGRQFIEELLSRVYRQSCQFGQIETANTPAESVCVQPRSLTGGTGACLLCRVLYSNPNRLTRALAHRASGQGTIEAQSARLRIGKLPVATCTLQPRGKVAPLPVAIINDECGRRDLVAGRGRRYLRKDRGPPWPARKRRFQ